MERTPEKESGGKERFEESDLPTVFMDWKDSEEIRITNIHREQVIDWLGTILVSEDLYENGSLLARHMDRTDRYFGRVGINRHDMSHIKRVTADAILIYFSTRGLQDFQAGKKSAHDIIVKALTIAIAALHHDIGYIGTHNITDVMEQRHNLKNGRPADDGSSPKDMFDPHPQVGAEIISKILTILFQDGTYKESLRPEYRDIRFVEPGMETHGFGKIIRDVVCAILDHDTPKETSDLAFLSSPTASLCLCLADKIHLGGRAPSNLDSSALSGENRDVHNVITFAIKEEMLEVDLRNRKIYVCLDVDLDDLNREAGLSKPHEKYTPRKFAQDFRIFEKRYRRLQKIGNALLGLNVFLPHSASTFSIRLSFTIDGRTESKEIMFNPNETEELNRESHADGLVQDFLEKQAGE